MSNIYIQEPPTNGKVLLKTSVGDVDIELWSKEAPKACRNFVQLCLEGYYDSTAFHRVVKDFIVQGGDPTDSGEGGESVYGAPFKDEIHSRLRFVRRGLVAMANGGPHDNGSQFFFTMAATPELQNKHTIFGKVVGDTLFNMLKLQDVVVDEASERPQDPHRILSTEVLNNPYDDIVPRQIKRGKKDKEEEKRTKSKSKATKNFSLLSFGDEAEDDEEQVDKATESFRGKSKSSHDLTDDPRLSSVPAVDKEKAEEEKRRRRGEGSPEAPGNRKPEAEDKEAPPPSKTEPADDEVKKKPEPPEEARKRKPDPKDEEKKKRRSEQPAEGKEKKSSPAAEDAGDAKKRKAEGEEDGKRAAKEEPKEEGRKKKAEGEATQDSRKRKGDDPPPNKDDRKKQRSKEAEEDERRKRKAEAKEDDSRKKRKGEETKEEPKKKVKTEVEVTPQPAEEDKGKDAARRKAKKDKEAAPKDPPSLVGLGDDSKQNRVEELKKEQRKLHKDIRDFKKQSEEKAKVKVEEKEAVEEEDPKDEAEENDLLTLVKTERQKYKSRKKQLGRRGNREEATLAMLAKFQSRLAAAHTVAGDYDDVEEEKPADEDDDADDMSWMRHKLHFEDDVQKTKVIDANVQDSDRYTLIDPRNPLNQRRRESSKRAMRDKR